MLSTFDVVDIDRFEHAGDEQMGTKDKRWISIPSDVDSPDVSNRWLYKVPKRFPGEVWSEKLAYEIAIRMEIPAPEVKLAMSTVHDDQGLSTEYGTISRSFVRIAFDESLVHGNELTRNIAAGRLVELDKKGLVGIDGVLAYLKDNDVQAPVVGAAPDHDGAFYFSGYLVFDALIGNVDRHHQNWGTVQRPNHPERLAPSFDNAACLGRELMEKKRSSYLDHGTVGKYVDRGIAPIAAPGTGTYVSPVELVRHLPALGQHSALCYWLERALQISEDEVRALFECFPPGFVVPQAQTFALTYFAQSQLRLRNIMEKECT